MMAPGREIQVSLGSALDFFADPRPDVPFHYVVKSMYTDLAGKRTYSDPAIHLDLNSYENTLVSTDHIANIDTHLKGIERHTKAWTAHDALRVRDYDQEQKDNRATSRWMQRRDRRLRQEQGWVALLKGEAEPPEATARPLILRCAPSAACADAA